MVAPNALEAEQVKPTEKSREDLLRWLDSEIEEASSQHSRQGWNTWVVIAALAAVLATALRTWESTQIALPEVERWLVALCLVMYPVVGFAYNIVKSYTSDLGERRVRLAAAGGPEERLRFVIIAVYYLVLALAAYGGRDGVGQVAAMGTVTLFIILFVTAIYGLTAHYGRTEIKRVQNYGLPVWVAIVGCLFLPVTLLFYWLGLAYFRAIQPLGAGKALPDLRFAALVIAGALIILLLTGVIQRPSTLRNLLRIRRDIFLNRVSTERAWLETEVTLVGMNAPARREYYCSELAAGHIQFQRIWIPIGRQLVEMSSQLDALQNDETNEKAVKLAELQKEFTRLQKAVAGAKKKLTELEKRQEKRLKAMTGGETEDDAAELAAASSRLEPTYAVVVAAQNNSTELLRSGEELVNHLRESFPPT